jgi:thiol:disulfide interchange protein/DsbC/DsbD-like thiol-disulfide interchange protein
MLLRVPLLLLAFAIALVAPAAHAQVQATLVAADQSVQPGRAVTVALRLAHDAHWHSYWINPGTGYKTSLAWKLPPGWKATDIQWPTPQVVRDTTGMITGNGYEGVVYLPVTLTPPNDLKPGDTVTLTADAKWLMCAEVCVPGKATVSITLPIRAEAPVADATHGTAVAATVAALPREVPGLTARATRSGKTITLQLKAAPGVSLSKPQSPWFFSTDKAIQFDEPQTVQPSGSGDVLVLDLPVSPHLTTPSLRLTGVLRTEGTWATDGSPLPGIIIDTPIEEGPPAAAVSGLSTLNSQPSTPSLGITRASPETTVAVDSLIGTLALAFIGGLILNLMPCVFPVLGIKILGFVNQAGADRRKVTLHGLAFAGGVLLSFWTLAGVLAVLRAGGGQLGWGFQLQSPGFVFTLAAIMLVFALSMSGVFEFGLRATGVGAGLQSKQGFSGSFFTGVLATVVATPCSAPFLAPALGAALALPTLESFTVFTAIALGLALPYLLLSMFPQAVKALPRPGAWMETFKQVMAFPLYATVGFLVWVLAGQLKSNDTALLAVLLGLTVIALGAWLYGHYATFGGKPARVRFGIIGGIALLSFGAWLGWPRPAAPTDIIWQPWSAEAVAKAVADGKPVYVDFTARWCFTCQTNKKVVFSSAEVLKTFRDKQVVTLRGDWTDEDPLITAELTRWNRSAVPFNLVYLPGKPDTVALPELLTPGIVLNALKSAP